MPTFDAIREDYAIRWAAMAVRPEWLPHATAAAQRIIGVRDRYEAVSATTNVPWFVIGIIHQMECGGSFLGHLHNGDPLTRRTVQVPKGRPVAPPADGRCYTWEESALDALRYDGIDQITDWGPERLAYCLEKYNGFGSRNRGVPSAYLWSGTDQYTRGKYIRDGVWSATAVSGQVGGMAILKALLDSDAGISFDGADLATAANEFPKADKAPEADDALPTSAAVHADAHDALQQASTFYAANGNAIRGLGLSAGALMAFFKEHAFEIVLVALVGIVAFELMRLAQRMSVIKKGGMQ